MDDSAIGAVSAVWHESTEQAERWFDILREEYRTGQTWDDFRQALAGRAAQESFAPETVESFTQYVEDSSSDPMHTVGQLADPDQKDAILRTYSEAVEAAYADTGEHASFDEDAWLAYLHQWDGDWDGTEDSWSHFAERVVYYAPDEFKAAATEFVGYCESAPDKVAAIAEYGLTVGTGDIDAGEADIDAGEADIDAGEDDIEADIAKLFADVEPEHIEAVDEVAEHLMDAAKASVLENISELAERLEMSEEEVRELIEEMGDEHLIDAVYAELGAED